MPRSLPSINADLSTHELNDVQDEDESVKEEETDWYQPKSRADFYAEVQSQKTDIIRLEEKCRLLESKVASKEADLIKQQTECQRLELEAQQRTENRSQDLILTESHASQLGEKQVIFDQQQTEICRIRNLYLQAIHDRRELRLAKTRHDEKIAELEGNIKELVIQVDQQNSDNEQLNYIYRKVEEDLEHAKQSLKATKKTTGAELTEKDAAIRQLSERISQMETLVVQLTQLNEALNEALHRKRNISRSRGNATPVLRQRENNMDETEIIDLTGELID
jgi:chromosome segregation ATPase